MTVTKESLHQNLRENNVAALINALFDNREVFKQEFGSLVETFMTDTGIGYGRPLDIGKTAVNTFLIVAGRVLEKEGQLLGGTFFGSLLSCNTQGISVASDSASELSGGAMASKNIDESKSFINGMVSNILAMLDSAPTIEGKKAALSATIAAFALMPSNRLSDAPLRISAQQQAFDRGFNG